MTEMSKSYADALFSLALETNTVYETLVTLKEMRDGLTATEGVFVAGDCRSKRIRQVVTAAADGAIAAMAACRYLD